jgi:hypothetical protein
MSNPFDFSNVDLGDYNPADIFGSPSTAGGGFDFGSIMPDSDGGMSPPTLNSGIFSDIAGLVNAAYQGQAQVEQTKLANKIASARLANQLETVRTTPNVWLIGAAAVAAAFFIFDRRDSRRFPGAAA